MVALDYHAEERSKAEFDVEEMKVVWAGSRHAYEVSDRVAHIVASDPALWLDGLYDTDATKTLHGVLTIPLANGDNVNLYMSKKVHREFVLKLLALSHSIRTAMKIHEDLSETLRGPAELIMGSFDGIKASG